MIRSLLSFITSIFASRRFFSAFFPPKLTQQRMISTNSSKIKLTIPTLELKNMKIGYCTDIEGNYMYWQRYVKLSKVLKETSTGIELNFGCYFVYGGDVCDRGYGDLRILHDLIQLKKRNPERVFLILGNRDLNKMRLLTELQEESFTKEGETFWTGKMNQTNEFNRANRLKAV